MARDGGDSARESASLSESVIIIIIIIIIERETGEPRAFRGVCVCLVSFRRVLLEVRLYIDERACRFKAAAARIDAAIALPPIAPPLGELAASRAVLRRRLAAMAEREAWTSSAAVSSSRASPSPLCHPFSLSLSLGRVRG